MYKFITHELQAAPSNAKEMLIVAILGHPLTTDEQFKNLNNKDLRMLYINQRHNADYDLFITFTNDKNPANIVYNLPGLFTVCLDARNAFGFASSCKDAYIRVLGPTNAKIVMTEIMYNPPELGTDTLEFIELYNNDVVAWNLEDFYFEQGITYVFPDVSVNPGAYLLVAKNAAAMQHAFGVTALQWTDGSLSNSGEPIVIHDNYGYLVDSVYYGVTPPWDTLANGFGSSLELCNPNLDNTDPLNWRHAIEFQAVNASGDTIWASPLAGCS